MIVPLCANRDFLASALSGRPLRGTRVSGTARILANGTDAATGVHPMMRMAFAGVALGLVACGARAVIDVPTGPTSGASSTDRPASNSDTADAGDLVSPISPAGPSSGEAPLPSGGQASVGGWSEDHYEAEAGAWWSAVDVWQPNPPSDAPAEAGSQSQFACIPPTWDAGRADTYGDGGGSANSPLVGAWDLPAEAAARWIAFDSSRHGDPQGFYDASSLVSNFTLIDRDIYLIRADGSQLVQLTAGPSTDREPSFSHDGTRLAFTSNRSGSFQVHVMNLATGAVMQLTSMTSEADQPNWSFDDEQIVFHSAASVYVMAADGSNPRPIATGPESFNSYKYPSLSADGTEVLCDRNNEIDAIRIDQRNCPPVVGGRACLRYVVQNWTTTEETPALSPDGTQVAYAVYCQGLGIAVTPFAACSWDPCGPLRITPGNGPPSRRPAWGPAGIIAFERALTTEPYSTEPIRTAAIVLTTSRGGTARELVGPPGDHRNPNWAPAGFQAKGF